MWDYKCIWSMYREYMQRIGNWFTGGQEGVVREDFSEESDLWAEI